MLVCSCVPAFAVAENTEYENALKAGWGNSIGGYTNPSGYNTSWNMQVLRFLNSEYNTLGTLSTLLNSIHTETNYIPTINTHLNDLKSGWGNWTSGYTYPAGYGSSWYRLMFEGMNYISGTLERIEQIESDSAISNIADILYDNYNHGLIPVLKRNNQYPVDSPTSTSLNPLNVSYLNWDSTNNVYTMRTGGTGEQRSIYTMLGYTNTNIVQLFTALSTIGTQYRNQYVNFVTGSPSWNNEGTDYVRSYSIMDQLHNMARNDAQYESKVGYILDHVFNHNISNINSSYLGVNYQNTLAPNGTTYTNPISNIDILKPIYISWRDNTTNYGGSYGISDSISNASLTDYLAVLNSNVVNGISALYTPNHTYQYYYLSGTKTVQSKRAYSIADMLWGVNMSITDYTSRFIRLYADDDTISAKQANKNQEQAVLTNFSGAGNSAPTVSNYNDVNSAVTSVKSGLNTGVQPSAMTSIFNSNDGIGWFSQSTMNSLDATVQTRSIEDYHEEYYWDKYNELYNIVTRGIE